MECLPYLLSFLLKTGKSGSEEDLHVALSTVEEPPYSGEPSDRDELALPIILSLWKHPVICDSPNSVVKEDQSEINLITERQCEAVEPPDDLKGLTCNLTACLILLLRFLIQ